MSTTTTDAARFEMSAAIVKHKAASSGQKATIIATASSDSPDLSGDVMSKRALSQMRDAFAAGLLVFLNHAYKIPEDVAGLTKSASLVTREGRTDLDLSIEIDESNPRAVQVFEQIKAGQKLGLSIGVMVNESARVDRDGQKILEIRDVTTLEVSIVGIPANRDSWIRDAYKAASFALKSSDPDPVDPMDGSDAERLWRFLALAYKARALIAEQQHSDLEKSSLALVALVDQFLDQPNARKVANVEQFDAIAARYPYLHNEIIGQLAISASPTK